MYLMHDNIPVAKVIMAPDGTITGCEEVINPEHLPVGTAKQSPLLWRLLANWQRERALPISREQYEIYANYFGVTALETKQVVNGLSLNDHYWFCLDPDKVLWEDVCFQKNGFSNHFGDFFLLAETGRENHIGVTKDSVNRMIPDLTTDGLLKKIWLHTQDGAKLFKFGDFGNDLKCNLLSANEIAVSRIARSLDIDIVDYYPALLPGLSKYVCVCDSFIGENEELVTFAQLLKAEMCEGKKTDLYVLLYRLGFQKEVDDMIHLDFYTHQRDRHTKNGGIIRDAKTLKIKRFAPLFDQGSSLNYNGAGSSDDTCKPFKSGRLEQLLLTEELPEFPDINKMGQKIAEVYNQFHVPDSQLEKTILDLADTRDLYMEAQEEKQRRDRDKENAEFLRED